MSPDWAALAYATELSERTFAATARLIGAATFALISDIAARSGSSSPAIAFSSSRVSCLYSWSLPTAVPPSVLCRLVDGGLLDRVRVCRRVVRQHVGGERDVHGNR